MKIRVTTTMACAPTTEIEIPVKRWDEIKEWYVKWDTFHFTKDGDKWEEIALNTEQVDAVDWKRPAAVEIVDPETGETLDDE